MQRTLLLVLAAIVLASSSLPADAQKFLPKSIQFKGDPEYSDEELMAAAGLKKGLVLTAAEMGEHSKQLMDTGVFDNLTYKFDGQDLVYQLTPASLMYPIRLENLPLTPGKDLDAALHDRFPLYHGKVPPEGGLLESVRQALEEMLAAKGMKATVAATPFGALGSHKVTAINFAITTPPVRVGAIRLEGVSPAMETKIRSLANHSVGAPFDTENSERNLEHAFQQFYADEGYAAVKVHAARAGDPVVADPAIDIPFSVTIEEGRLYKLGFIHLPPDALVTQAEIDKATGPRVEGSAKGLTLRTLWSQIVSRYKSKGYLDCTIAPHPEFDEASGTVNYTVDIDSGPVYHLAFVKFENVSDELRARLMRIWQMLPGDPFNESYVSNFIARVQKEDPGLQATLATVKITYDVRADPLTREVNCVIRLEKRQ
jgi:outer membrane protein insertion porin family